MERVILKRVEQSASGTFGTLTHGTFQLVTGEQPWRDNKSDISCIPPGIFVCRVTPSNRFKRDLYEVFGVPDRFAIRIHPANFMGDREQGFKSELNGCIALGLKKGMLEGQAALLTSRVAVDKFMERMKRQEFELEVLS